MNIRLSMPRRYFPSTAILVLGGVLFARGAFGGGTISNCTQADLQAALAGGGTAVFACGGTLTLTSTITISQNTVLDAGGYDVAILGGQAVRLFQVMPGVTFWIKGLTLAGGQVTGSNGANGDPPSPGQDAYGAGILNLGASLTLTGCTLSNNAVVGGNAGEETIYSNTTTTNGGAAYGAAIYSAGGVVNLTNCNITHNFATGGLGSQVNSFYGYPGNSGEAFGGALYLTDGASATLEDVMVTSNSVTGGAPLSWNGSAGKGGDAAGGGIYATNSAFVLSGSAFSGNLAQGGGFSASGDIASGLGSGVALGGCVFLSSNSSAHIDLSAFTDSSALGGAGARYQPAGAGRGGAIFSAGQLGISDSIFEGDQSLGNLSISASAGQGGAIYSTSALTVNGCTFDNNSALGGRASSETGNNPFPGAPGEGGALWSSGSLLVTNSTLAANSATGGMGGNFGPGGAGAGGAILICGGTATLVNVTIATNRADGATLMSSPPGPSEGGGLSVTNGAATVRGSILAYSANGGDAWGAVSDAGYSICSDGTVGFSAQGSVNQTDPLLGALSNNGGPTPTMPLLVGSPARDAIPSGFPPTDQRGVTRPQGPAADIGAFEADFVPQSPVIVTQPQGQRVRAGTNVIFTTVASGLAPLYYQWRKDGTAIARATTTLLSLTNVQAADAGTYSIYVTNSLGNATSQGAALVIDSTPLILSQPTSVAISPGAATNFVVSADGPALSYQWWHDSSPISAATGSVYSIANASPGDQGNYFAAVSNFAGTTNSAVASLAFDSSALSILGQPKDQTVEAGYPASFSVLVSGVPPFAYQWQHGGLAIAGATDSSFKLASVSTNDAGSYSVVVTNGYRMLTSNAAQLTVTPGAAPPLLVAGLAGANLTITFNAEAGRTYRLLWSANFAAWTPVATNSTVTAGQVQFVRPTGVAPFSFYRVVTQ